MLWGCFSIHLDSLGAPKCGDLRLDLKAGVSDELMTFCDVSMCTCLLIPRGSGIVTDPLVMNAPGSAPQRMLELSLGTPSVTSAIPAISCQNSALIILACPAVIP